MHAGRIGHPTCCRTGCPRRRRPRSPPTGSVFTAERPAGLRRPARADRRQGIRADRRGLRRGGPQRRRGRLRRGRAARRQRLPAPPVPRPQHQPAHRRAGAARAEGRIRFAVEVVEAVAARDRRRADGPADLAGQPVQRHRRDRPGAGLHRAGRRRWSRWASAYLHVVETAPGTADAHAASCASASRHPDPQPVHDRRARPAPRRWGSSRTAPPTCSPSARCSWPTPTCPPGCKAGGPFNTPDTATFYGGDDKGYTDYPAL